MNLAMCIRALFLKLATTLIRLAKVGLAKVGHSRPVSTVQLQTCVNLTMDLAYICVKYQMRLHVCHQMRLLNPQRSSLHSLTIARFARFLTV